MYHIKMKEKVDHIKVSTRKNKKYMAIVKDLITNKERKIHFGARNYQQFKDSTNLKQYSSKNHNDHERKRRYYLRHSGVDSKKKAVKKEVRKSKGIYTAKILSHLYLW